MSQYGYGPGRGMEAVSGKAGRVADPDPGRGWGFGEPEVKRKKRIARYEAYTVEGEGKGKGKVKASFKRGLLWVKNKCSQMINGY